MKLNPVTVEVIRNRLIAASRDIRLTVQRAAYSPVLAERVDFSCGILDRESNLVAETPGLPIFLASLSYAVKSTYDTIGYENIRPGDVFLCNDPYNGGGTHCPDIVTLCPTFLDSTIYGWAAFRGHTVDVGGIRPAGWYSDTTEIFQEGLRLPPVKVVSEGVTNEDIFHIIQTNSRSPTAVAGDVRAMIAAVQVGSKAFLGVIEKYGSPTTMEVFREILNQGEKMSREAIRQIPNGTYLGEAILDGDGNDDARLDERVCLKMSITVKDEEMILDFTGSGPPCQGPMNVPEPSTISASRLAFKILTTPNLPNNDGFFRPLTIVIPDDSYLKARFPAATALWPTPATLIPDLALKALAPAMPDRVRAGHFGDAMASFIYGTDPRTNVYYVAPEGKEGGYGGKPHEDGEPALFSMTLGDTYNLPGEAAELKYPWRLERLELRQNSGGAGKFRGGLGVRRDYRIIGHEAGVTVTADRAIYTPPWGLFGGREGATCITIVYRNDGREEHWQKISGLPLRPDDVLSFRSGGGGGYGVPYDRDPEMVLSDVKNGYVTLSRAKDDYGVVIDVRTMQVNTIATLKLRAEIQAKLMRKPSP